MPNVTLSFTNRSDMAYFIIARRISELIPDWQNVALTGDLNNNDIEVAFSDYDAHVTVSDRPIIILPF